MIRLITGLPGAGKTSNTLAAFLEIRDRPRYATAINGFDYEAHGVIPLDSLNSWESLPDGSLIFCDEAQQFLRPRGPKDKVPDWIAAFETHRHRGFDFWLTTQNPMLIDIHVRRLTGEHFHYYRPFGFKSVSLLKWEEVKDNPRDPREIQLAQKSRVTLPPAVFEHYKSTVVDTHKAKIPRVLIYMVTALLVGVLLVAGGVYKLTGRASDMLDGKAAGSEAFNKSLPGQLLPVQSAPGQSPATSSSGLYASSRDKPLTASDFVPVTALAPWSAPFYRDIAQPVAFPRFSGCMAFNAQCKCTTQQGTVIDVDESQCLAVIVQNKRPFDPHHPDSMTPPPSSPARSRPLRDTDQHSELVIAGTASGQSTSFIPNYR